MISSVRSRPSHYEVLGVSPGASDAEIAQAFARKMSLFGAHLMAEAPQISVAHEVLRDPLRRRDYDRSLGLHVEPEPHAWGFTVAPPRWMPLVAPVPNPPAQAEPHVESEPSLETPAPPRQPIEQLQRAPRPDPTEPLIQHILDVGREERERLYEDRDRPSFQWKKPAMAAGGLLVGAGVIGAAAGLSVKDNATAAKPEPALSVALPAARAAADAAVPAQEDSTIAPELPRAAAAPTRRRIPQPQRPTAFASDIAQSLSAEAPVVDAASPTPEVVQANLPLSNGVIARTIERIGYSCGEVASTAPAGSGAFTVTCSSGQSFEAKPVRGRYRFRRVAGG